MNLAELGKRIKSQRKKKQLTQGQLANSLYISAQAVSKWERGENAPDISLLPKLSILLDRSIEWIISGEDQLLSTFNATVLCSSMRSFLKKTESMKPENIALWVNGIFHTLTETVLVNDGVPVKYTGDGFLCYFAGHNHEKRALKTALSCCDTIKENDLLLTLHSGEVYLGAIGHQEYAQADIIGMTVNNTFILNRWATENSKANVVVTGSIYDAGKSVSEELKGESVDTGISLLKDVYEVTGW